MDQPYNIIAQPHTKPQRYMIVKDDHIIARGLTRATARHIIACLLLGAQQPAIITETTIRLKSTGI